MQQWLGTVGLEELGPVAIMHDIDGRQLLALDAASLRHYGVPVGC